VHAGHSRSSSPGCKLSSYGTTIRLFLGEGQEDNGCTRNPRIDRRDSVKKRYGFRPSSSRLLRNEHHDANSSEEQLTGDAASPVAGEKNK
jgi:hypothetical protein